MPANVPHEVHATEASRMLLIMLREAVLNPPNLVEPAEPL